MKERAELTGMRTYSTLNAGSIMDKNSPEGQDSLQNRPKTTGEIVRQRGIRVPKTLEEMQAQTRAAQVPEWDEGTSFPELPGATNEGAMSSYAQGKSFEQTLKEMVANGGLDGDTVREVLEQFQREGITQADREVGRAVREAKNAGFGKKKGAYNPYIFDAKFEVGVDDGDDAEEERGVSGGWRERTGGGRRQGFHRDDGSFEADASDADDEVPENRPPRRPRGDRRGRDPEADYYDDEEASRQAQAEARAFQLKKEFMPQGRALKLDINRFAVEVKLQGFDNDRYNELAAQIASILPEDRVTPEALALQEEVRVLGMALSRIAREAPQQPEELQAYSNTIDAILRIEDRDTRYGQLENIVAGIPVNEGRMYQILIELVVKKVQESGKREDVEFVLEYAAERFFAIADQDPDRQFPRLNMYAQQNLDGVLDMAKQYTDDMRGETERRGEKLEPKEDFFGYLTELVNRREIIHELYRQMNDPEKFKGGVADFLRKEGLKFVEDKVVGIPLVKRHFDRAYASRLSYRDGSWMETPDFENAASDVKNVLELQAASGELTKELDYGEKTERRMRQWEVDRAFSMGRAVMALSQRQASYTVMGDVPEDADEFLRSVDKELIIRTLGSLKLIAARFFDQPVAVKFLEHYLGRLTSKKKYGLDGKGIYGKKAESMALLDTGISDITSNGWRSHWLFLDQAEYGTERDERNEKVSFRVYLKEAKEHAKHETGIHHPHTHDEKTIVKNRVNEILRPAIQKQRLFLGTLIKHGDISTENKKILWEKVGALNPSRIAALQPDAMEQFIGQAYGLHDKRDIRAQWDKIKVKLWKLEDHRVEMDAQAIRNGIEISETKGLFAYNRISENNAEELVDFSSQERDVIGNLMEFGVSKADELSKVTFVFTPFLDDVPRTAWDNLGGQDVGRMLNDQASINEGLNVANGIIANPAQKPGKIIEALGKVFHSLSGPLGIETGQLKTEPFITAWVAMAKQNTVGRYDIGLADNLRWARSELEQYNLKCGIALDEIDIYNMYKKLAEHEVIADDLMHLQDNGKTQFQNLEIETGVTFKDRKFAEARQFFMMIFFLQLLQVLKLVPTK